MSNGFPKLSFVFGGAASGKSNFAENLAQSAGRDLVYIATAQGLDEEMQAKIKKHQNARGQKWTTIEEPLDLKAAVTRAPTASIVLIDCLTLWLSNAMHAELDVKAELQQLLHLIATLNTPVICVSNEVGLSLVAPTKLGRVFQNEQGRLNQAVASQADLAVFVAAGLPMVLKGAMPNGLT